MTCRKNLKYNIGFENIQTKISNRNIRIKLFEEKHLKYLILAFTVDIELRLAFVQSIFLFLQCFISQLKFLMHTFILEIK